ncbi:MAG TPA: PQQ-binding-like beta-propeller repeat protein [Roseiflexaceae bacterium]|nr:PQQ-binding-like beta-propeller repeat protein [Roseiflexaceae bacterium]HMP42300.1 PQQ-binding-like beta-propeller repeat protein [Roseiflexaceae bacterium]
MNDIEQRRLWILAIVLLIGSIVFVATRTSPSSTQTAAVPLVVPLPANEILFDPNAPPLPLAPPGTAEWAMEGLNPARTRASATALALPLRSQRQIGTASLDEAGSPPVVARGLALIELKDRLQAVELATGRERWSFDYRGLYVSPAVSGDMAYVRVEANNQGQLIALNLDDGTQVWSFTPRRLSRADTGYFGGHLTSPVIVDGMVIIGAGQEVYALDALDGQVRWEFATQDLITSSAAVADGQIYISDFRFTYAIDQANGTMVWSRPMASAIYFAPVVTDQSLLVSSGDRLIVLARSDGRELWSAGIEGQTLIPAGAQGNHAFIKSNETLYAYNLTSGEQLWQYHNINFVSLPAVAGDQAFVVSGLSGNTELVALDIATGASIWAQPLRSLAPTAPIIAGQTVYVRTTDGQVVSLWQ